jgi:UDP-glucose 4-epimerase
MMRVLVTGAAGYIGSIVTEHLIASGYDVLAMDNLSHGHRRAVHPEAHFFQGDLLEREWLHGFLRRSEVEAVVHLAAEALIDGSVRDPGRFFRANIVGGLNLLDGMAAARIQRLVFSSTAAVYGEPETIPIPETAPCRPVNPYGESKLAFERMLPWYEKAHGIRFIAFRYFNACGATERFGEDHIPETHLVPVIFEAALGKRPAVELFGDDYDTPDGTCIRDYIHVADIARAHELALRRLEEVSGAVYNLGNGRGYSTREVLETAGQVIGKPVPVVRAARRPGDPARLVADPGKIRRELGWEPLQDDLSEMIRSAWRWRRRHPQGYAQ